MGENLAFFLYICTAYNNNHPTQFITFYIP